VSVPSSADKHRPLIHAFDRKWLTNDATSPVDDATSRLLSQSAEIAQRSSEVMSVQQEMVNVNIAQVWTYK
jgi:hypothetical protein